jgi:hypothetical protein
MIGITLQMCHKCSRTRKPTIASSQAKSDTSLVCKCPIKAFLPTKLNKTRNQKSTNCSPHSASTQHTHPANPSQRPRNPDLSTVSISNNIPFRPRTNRLRAHHKRRRIRTAVGARRNQIARAGTEPTKRSARRVQSAVLAADFGRRHASNSPEARKAVEGYKRPCACARADVVGLTLREVG